MMENNSDFGIDDFDDANIPVDIRLEKLGDKYVLTASNYMPRKDAICEGVLGISSNNKQELMDIVKDKFLPIYEKAVQALIDISEGKREDLYYWN